MPYLNYDLIASPNVESMLKSLETFRAQDSDSIKVEDPRETQDCSSLTTLLSTILLSLCLALKVVDDRMVGMMPWVNDQPRSVGARSMSFWSVPWTVSTGVAVRLIACALVASAPTLTTALDLTDLSDECLKKAKKASIEV